MKDLSEEDVRKIVRVMRMGAGWRPAQEISMNIKRLVNWQLPRLAAPAQSAGAGQRARTNSAHAGADRARKSKERTGN